MILVTHAVIGGAVMKLLPNHPALGLGLALISHFVFDAVPHWGYQLKSYDYNKEEPLKSVLNFNKDFSKDLVKILLDGILGLILPLFLFGPNLFIFLGAGLAMLPDFFQFLYLTIKKDPFRSIQKLHHWFHTPFETKEHNFLGLASNAIIIAAIYFLIVSII